MAEKIQRGFEDTMHGDLEALRSLYATDFVCHVPGRSDMSGDLHGYDEVLRWYQRLLELCDGNYREESLAVVADDGWAFQLTAFRAAREDRKLEGQSVNVYRIREGRLVEVWVFFDTEVWDEFWSHGFDPAGQPKEVLDYV